MLTRGDARHGRGWSGEKSGGGRFCGPASPMLAAHGDTVTRFVCWVAGGFHWGDRTMAIVKTTHGAHSATATPTAAAAAAATTPGPARVTQHATGGEPQSDGARGAEKSE